ncbi:MAG: HAMP domain-containing histidine kinase, partial [Sphingobacteriia bacterium]|nr:HAMP domain-containing histidine kinase [Sphingobacteriia bacterium]
NAFKSAFVANISHDLRTPLNAIVGFSDLLADPDASNKDRSYYNSLIQSNSKVLIGLINDIIDLSRIESRQLSIRMESFCPYEELQALLPVLSEEQNRLSKSHLVLKLEATAELQQMMIVSDKNRFRQVLVNLSVNAIKFTKEGFVMIGINPPQNGVITFYVKDTGEGLKPDQQEKIFERYYRADRKNTIQGSGLGLAISKALVEMLGGEIGVHSISGVGSTFWFSLPSITSTSREGASA